ncbi:hypothetical protein FRC0417_01953 [Corynebacterium diphtheriae]|nr:hypothetical protein FRC0417_01953 [Corynebacterium diphtheriae]
MEVEDIDNLSRNQDIAVGLQVILKPRARPTPDMDLDARTDVRFRVLGVMSRDVVLAPARNDTVPIQEVSVQTACH